MRVIFAGRNNSFNRRLVSELFEDHELLSCLWLEGPRETWSGKLNMLRRRGKRHGLVRMLNQFAFQLLDRTLYRKHTRKFMQEVPEYFFKWADISAPGFDVDNIHSKEWLEHIRELKPDIVFSVCCTVIFRPSLINIAKYGTFILHEGLTPEYKGLHTPIWAMLNNEPEFLGYSVLKANKEIDGGEVLVQDGYQLADDEDVRCWSWVAHKAIIDGVPKIKAALESLESNGGFEPVATAGRKHGYYSRVPLSQYLWKRIFPPKPSQTT